MAAGSIECNYDATYHQATVTLAGDVEPYLARDVAGHITLNGSWCGYAATVTNTDSITVIGDATSQGVELVLANGGFKPGRTNEPGKSDEIEFTVNLGAGAADEIRIIGSDAADKIDIGQGPTQFGIVRRINLNAGESTGVDSDVAMVNVEKVMVFANGGNDVIRARGKAGTGPDALNLIGDEGKDTMWGYGTGDSIYMNDGALGDVGYGGDGIDDSIYDPGDTWDKGPQ
jgi:hypothetical protein